MSKNFSTINLCIFSTGASKGNISNSSHREGREGSRKRSKVDAHQTKRDDGSGKEITLHKNSTLGNGASPRRERECGRKRKPEPDRELHSEVKRACKTDIRSQQANSSNSRGYHRTQCNTAERNQKQSSSLNGRLYFYLISRKMRHFFRIKNVSAMVLF